jgi:hypothetical protein
MTMRCYLCGRALSRHTRQKDHVPPTCMFPEPKPRNLITVYCCDECHRRYDKLDERMRTYISIVSGDKSGSVGETALRSLRKRPALVADFLAHTVRRRASTDALGIDSLYFYFTAEELHGWLTRLVRGLHFRRTERLLGTDAQFVCRARTDVGIPDLGQFGAEPGLEFQPHFAYGATSCGEGTEWFLLFYEHVAFTVDVTAGPA